MPDVRSIKLGDHITEFTKSKIPAGSASPNGLYSFYCSGPEKRWIDRPNMYQEAIILGTGGVASVHYAIGEFAYSTDTWAIAARNGSYVGTPYLFRILEAQLSSIDYAAFEGSGLRHLRKDFIRDLIIEAPNPDTQHRIAEILSTVDEAIEQTEALIAKTQQIKAGLMHDLFTRGVTADGKLRPSREEAPLLYRQSSLGWIPKEWDIGHLSERRAPNRAHIKTGPFGSSLKLEHWVDEGVPVITIGALGEGEFIQSQLLHVSQETANRLCEYSLREGDVVFSRVADVGRSAVITEIECGWIMSSNLMRISLDCDQVIPQFLQAQLAYDYRVRAQIRATVNAGGREVANSTVLNRLIFCWPFLAEQKQIVGKLSALEGRRNCLIENLQKLKLVKSGLIQDLMAGKTPIKIDRNNGKTKERLTA